MKLELNTNGAWRTVLTNLGGRSLEAEDQLADARTAAAILAEISNPKRERRCGITWRLVDEKTGRVVSHCDAGGWVDVRKPSAPKEMTE